MGLNVELQDEQGNTLQALPDPQNSLARLLPLDNEELYPTLAGIDLYGDTLFNRVQMGRFLREWRIISAQAQSQDERGLLAAIESMALRCSNEVHLYLKFIGD